MYDTKQKMALSCSVHQKKQARTEAQQQGSYQMITETLPYGIWTIDPDGRTSFRNQHWTTYTGLSAKSLLKDDWQRIVHPYDLPDVLRRWKACMQTGSPLHCFYRVRGATHTSYHWHMLHILPIRDQQGVLTQWLGTSTDVENWEHTEEASHQGEYNFYQLADTMPHLVWIVRPNGTFEYGNQPWIAYTGLVPEQTCYAQWIQVIHPEDRPRNWEQWKHCIETGTLYSMEYRLRRASDDAYRWHLGRAFAIRDKQGRIQKWLGTCTDIEEQKQAQVTMLHLLDREQEARKESDQANQVLRNFMSTVSHEFRTTLTGIQGFSDLLRRQHYPEEVREFAADIHSNALRLNRMINDLLDMEKMQSGRMILYCEALNLNLLIEKEVERMQRIAPDYHFHLHLDKRVPCISGDQDKLIQVITNLLSNAVKYAPDSPDITISSKLEEQQIHIQIRDQGLGIPADAIDKIFLPYHRVHSEPTHFIGGTGLGLPIVQQILEMHQGHIWVESTPGEGSTFHFTLPCQEKSPDIP